MTGRPRDSDIDERVLAAALDVLASGGLGALTIAGVAERAGTTRQAVYRRHPDPVALAIAAVSHLAEVAPPPVTGEPFKDLVAEMEHFRHCITDAAALPLAGLMLSGDVEPRLRDAYVEQLVVPRRARIRACLQAGVDRGQLPADADLALAGTMLTGSWYAMFIAGAQPPPDWSARVVALVWRACGGSPP